MFLDVRNQNIYILRLDKSAWRGVMSDRILFLGTSGDAIVTGKQLRSSAGIVINTENDQYIMDPGPGTLVRAAEQKVNLRNTTGILVSHNHLNHSHDTNAVISAMTHGGLDTYGVLVCSKTVLNGNEDMYPTVSKYHRRALERTIALSPYQKVGINDLEVEAIPAVHSDPEALGFRLVAQKFILSYTGDTIYDPKVVEGLKDCDILVLNVVAPPDVTLEHNLNAEDAMNIIQEVKPNLAILTHFGIKMLSSDPLAQARDIQKKTKVQTVAAKDGLVINPATYASKSRQKKLASF